MRAGTPSLAQPLGRGVDLDLDEDRVGSMRRGHDPTRFDDREAARNHSPWTCRQRPKSHVRELHPRAHTPSASRTIQTRRGTAR